MTPIELNKAIRTAIKTGETQTAVSLIKQNPSSIREMTVFGTWLHVAASFGNLELVKILVAMGADVNAQGGIAGGGALHRAASDGHLEVVEFLFESGALLDVSISERNPLFGAIYGGHLAIAKYLIDRGIDTKVKYSGKSMSNMDALAFAKERGQTAIASLIESNS